MSRKAVFIFLIFINIINKKRIWNNCFKVSRVAMPQQYFEKKYTKKYWKLLFHNCYQVNLKSPSYNLSSDITHIFSPWVVSRTCPGPWTINGIFVTTGVPTNVIIFESKCP